MFLRRNRVRSGVPEGGQFSAGFHNESGVTLSDMPAGVFRCVNCDRLSSRGSEHRCLSPGLVPLSTSAWDVLSVVLNAGGRPIIVGGSVRDSMIARMHGSRILPKDVDIEVYGLTAGELREALRPLGERNSAWVDEVGASFGVIKVHGIYGDFDVSLPRRDSKTGVGHRGFDVEIDPELSELEAFARRDFTVNAMGYDPVPETLIDHYGGSADLQVGVLRHVSDRFSDDPLRVLRGVQMAGRFDMRFAPETAELCRDLADRFQELPKERIWGEWEKIATRAESPSQSLAALHEVDWEKHFPELAACRDVAQDPKWHPEGPVHVHLGLSADAAATWASKNRVSENDRAVVVLASMFHDLGKATHTQLPDPNLAETPGTRITSHGHAEAGVEPASALLERIGAPAKYAEKILPIISNHMAVAGVQQGGTPSANAVRRLIRRLDAPGGRGPGLQLWAAVVGADHAGRGSASGSNPADAWVRVASKLGTADRPRGGYLTGHHLKHYGFEPGPVFGQILGAALRAQDEGEFSDEQSAVKWLESNMDQWSRE